jgi:L-arabinonolactonase
MVIEESAMTTAVTNRAARSLRWDASTQRWWWAGGSGTPAVYAWSPSNMTTLTCHLPDGAGVLAHCASGRLILALEKRLCVADIPKSGNSHQLRLQTLAAVDAAEPRTSVCEGRTDRRGFLVFGTANDGTDRRPIGSFFQYSSRYGLRRLALPAVTRASSICFDAAGSQMYFADAAGNSIKRCDYDAESGTVSNIRQFVGLENDIFPRGATIDAEGCLWSAQSKRLVRYARDGTVLKCLDIDCDELAFGGPDLAQLAAAGSAGLLTLPPSHATGISDTAFDDSKSS